MSHTSPSVSKHREPPDEELHRSARIRRRAAASQRGIRNRHTECCDTALGDLWRSLSATPATLQCSFGDTSMKLRRHSIENRCCDAALRPPWQQLIVLCCCNAASPSLCSSAIVGMLVAAQLYQVEVFEAALQGNTIAVLDTGSGKTMVAVLLARYHRPFSDGNVCTIFRLAFAAAVCPDPWFLSGRAVAIEVIREYTDLDVAECYGASVSANWSTDRWNKEVGSKDIVGCPEACLITMSAVSLLIFDECHSACGNHPYTRIMKDFMLALSGGQLYLE
ncbi:Endoribonuclease Dicer-3b-like protein [Hordeum vulgare]|nr:Endoribonuclease Dicer-3b-like protein [Hordeum vulgare]